MQVARYLSIYLSSCTVLCVIRICPPGECRDSGRSRAGPSDDGGEWDDWPREPDDDVMTQAYFDAKCAGDDGDFADLAYDNVYY